MKTVFITMIAIAVVFFGCGNLQPKPPAKDSATVQKIQGLCIFINADPMAEYTSVGKLELDGMQEIADSVKTGKNLLEKAETVLSEGYKDIDFSNKLEKMVGKVLEKYPDAEGVIFEGRINKCEAIKFK